MRTRDQGSKSSSKVLFIRKTNVNLKVLVLNIGKYNKNKNKYIKSIFGLNIVLTLFYNSF